MFQSWPGAHNELVDVNSFSSTRRKDQGDGIALSHFSVSEKLYLFLKTHKILSEAFSGV